jgi:hypothetical protein
MTAADLALPKMKTSKRQNPQSAIRNPKELRSPRPESPSARRTFQPSAFGLLSDFGFRPADFFGVWYLVFGVF